jgi:carboxyl-terminal processing protease
MTDYEFRLEHRPETRQRQHWRVGVAILSSIVLGWLVTTGCASKKPEPDLALITQAWNTIQRQYVDRSAVQSKELTYGAIGGMVEALGDTGHSTFLTPDMVKDLRNMERGEFKGVGLEIQMRDGHVVIVAPLDNSPAQRAGLRPGEIILKVGGQDISDWPLNRVVEHISGKTGTKVTLTLQVPYTGRVRDVTLTRAAIKLHEVTWRKLPGSDIAHVRLATFDAGVTRDLKKALEEIQKDDVKGIILDLRDNPGGLLDEAIGVASEFLNSGNVLLAKDAKGQLEAIEVEKGGLATNTPLVVLINEGSASAAEIVAGALQDNDRASLVGETTFGTGTVLGEFGLSDGSALLLAIEEWLTPNGHSIWHKGITPQFVVPLPPEITPLNPASEKEMTQAQIQTSDDRQLLRALELVSREQKFDGLKALSKPNK